MILFFFILVLFKTLFFRNDVALFRLVFSFYRYTRFVTFTRYYANERVSRICISHRSNVVKRFYPREIVIMIHLDLLLKSLLSVYLYIAKEIKER